MGIIQNDKNVKSNVMNRDDSNQKDRRNQEFLDSVKEQLCMETFQADVPEYSHEKVEAMVKIIDVEEGVDEDEVDESRRKFMENFQRISVGQKKKNRHSHYRRFARGAAAMLVILLAADITSQAVMDQNLFHMIESWTNQLIVMPGEAQPAELSDFQENETVIFENVEEFAEYFGEEFFVCGWLPEGVELKKIRLAKVENSFNYMWEYNNENENCKINIRMNEKSDNEIAGLVGTQIENENKIIFDNGIEATVYVNNDMCMGGFEYNGWWYIINSFGDESMLESIIGGMILYE
ncbi:MAG: hypothetical protein SOW08_00225 [Lachnospiraceae bacterium]|nr:hypothetical protein [Lachnospiraceae bacterium]